MQYEGEGYGFLGAMSWRKMFAPVHLKHLGVSNARRYAELQFQIDFQHCYILARTYRAGRKEWARCFYFSSLRIENSHDS